MQTKWLQQVAAGGDGAVNEQPPAGRWWWAGLAVGGAIVLFGLAGLLADADKTMPAVWVMWLVGSGVLALATVPVPDGVGRAMQPGHDPVLSDDYLRALASVVVLVWTGVLALAAVRHLRARGWTVRIRAP
jgi:hypothetical protein